MPPFFALVHLWYDIITFFADYSNRPVQVTGGFLLNEDSIMQKSIFYPGQP